MRKKSFTLMELMVVIIVIGILATLSVTQFTSSRERALDREAQSNLRLIISANRINRMENGNYYSSTPATPQQTIIDINNNLRLMLSSAANRSWDYIVTANNNPPTPTCCAQASRANFAPVRTFRMRNTEADPVAATCP